MSTRVSTDQHKTVLEMIIEPLANDKRYALGLGYNIGYEVVTELDVPDADTLITDLLQQAVGQETNNPVIERAQTTDEFALGAMLAIYRARKGEI